MPPDHAPRSTAQTTRVRRRPSQPLVVAPTLRPAQGLDGPPVDLVLPHEHRFLRHFQESLSRSTLASRASCPPSWVVLRRQNLLGTSIRSITASPNLVLQLSSASAVLQVMVLASLKTKVELSPLLRLRCVYLPLACVPLGWYALSLLVFLPSLLLPRLNQISTLMLQLFKRLDLGELLHHMMALKREKKIMNTPIRKRLAQLIWKRNGTLPRWGVLRI